MDTIELTIRLSEHLQDLFIAAFAETPMTGFLQEEEYLRAYIPEADWTSEMERAISTWLQEHGQEPEMAIHRLPEQNWNAYWEQSIHPVEVPPFIIRPTWRREAPVPEGRIELVIDPKMSFGTGHHETTQLMLRLLPERIRPGMRVLDAGTGTGILAIAAVKLGAREVIAFDIDPWAAENVAENLERNEVSHRVQFRQGSIDVVPEGDFDLILANINRNVLLELLPAFREKVQPRGHVVLSGILLADRLVMEEAFREYGFERVREAEEEEWWAVVLRKASYL